MTSGETIQPSMRERLLQLANRHETSIYRGEKLTDKTIVTVSGPRLSGTTSVINKVLEIIPEIEEQLRASSPDISLDYGKVVPTELDLSANAEPASGYFDIAEQIWDDLEAGNCVTCDVSGSDQLRVTTPKSYAHDVNLFDATLDEAARFNSPNMLGLVATRRVWLTMPETLWMDQLRTISPGVEMDQVLDESIDRLERFLRPFNGYSFQCASNMPGDIGVENAARRIIYAADISLQILKPYNSFTDYSKSLYSLAISLSADNYKYMTQNAS